MLPGIALEVLSRSLCDLLERDDIPFGGLVVVMDGNFPQVLPVVVHHAGRSGIVRSTVLKSKVWKGLSVQIMQLSKNMRLQIDLANTNDPDIQEVLSHFASLLLRIGEDVEPSPINLPHYIFQTQDTNQLINCVFDNPSSSNPTYWSERAILCPKNRDVQLINDIVSSRLPNEDHVFLSIDNIVTEEPNDPAHALYPLEFLNSLEPSGLSPHHLTLKNGMLIMLLRNLSSTLT